VTEEDILRYSQTISPNSGILASSRNHRHISGAKNPQNKKNANTMSMSVHRLIQMKQNQVGLSR
tara:strand:- start:191 stop:382 length:192 start_codon:yes stop_codon:yes gene_type:complete